MRALGKVDSMIDEYPRWYKVFALGAITLVLRFLYIAIAGRNVGIEPGRDAVSYDAFARLMMSGWEWISTPIAVREPLYPAFMAFSYAMPGSEIGTMQFLQALLGAAAVVVTYLALRSLVQESTAFLGAVLIALNPHFIAWTPEPLRENLIIPLLAFSLVMFLLAMSNKSILQLFFFALFYTLLIHTDARFLPLVAVFPLMVFTYHRQVKVTVKQSMWIWLFVVVLMIPYQIRGFVALGKPVIVTERFLGKWRDRATSVTSRSGSVDSGNKRLDWLRQFESEKRQGWEQLRPEDQQYFLAGGRPSVGRIEVHWDLFTEYWRFARFKPKYRPYPDGRFAGRWSFRHNFASSLVMVPFLILLPFVFLGSSRESRKVAFPLMVFLVAHSLMHVFVHARERYRIPLEIIMAILLSMAIVNLWSLWRRKKEARLNRMGQYS